MSDQGLHSVSSPPVSPSEITHGDTYPASRRISGKASRAFPRRARPLVELLWRRAPGYGQKDFGCQLGVCPCTIV